MKDIDPGQEESALRVRFAALRRADGALAPSFDRVLDRPRKRAFAWPGLLAAATVASVVAVVMWVVREPPPALTPAVVSEVMVNVAAEMPSDFLLAPPSEDVRRDAPRLRRAANEEVPFL